MTNATINHTVIVPVAEIESFRKQISKFNKKASKAGANPVEIVSCNPFEAIKEVTEDGIKVTECFEMVLESTTFKIGNYKTDAIISLDDTGIALVHSFSDKFRNIETDDVDFRRCDHCNVRHARKTVVVLDENGKEIQVGKSCVKDYMGVSVSTFEWIVNEFKAITEKEYEMSSYGYLCDDVGTVLAVTHNSVKANGYVKVDDADIGVIPTKLVVGEMLRSGKYTLTEEDCAWADMAIDLIKNMLPTNDYQHNIHKIVKNGYCSHKNLGILCSAIVMIQKMQQREKVQSDAVESKHVGDIKERITFNGEFLVKVPMDGFYGMSMLYIIQDDEGNQYKWISTSANHFDHMVGDKAEIVGTVSKHDEFRGVKQTILKRCKVNK